MNRAWIERDAGVARTLSGSARAEEPALDPAVILNLWEVADGDGHFIPDLLDLYVDQAREIVAAMRAALSANDRRSFRNGAHKLAGSSLYAGAVAVATISQRLEIGNEEVPAQADLEALESEVRRVAVAIAKRKWLPVLADAIEQELDIKELDRL